MKKKILAYGMCALMLLVVFSSGCRVLMLNVEGTEASSVKSENSGLVSHDPIHIDGNDDFVVGQNGVASGSGTKGNPYIIENWDIDASTADGIYIKNTDVYFIIRNCEIHDGKSNSNYGIYFGYLTYGEIKNVISYNNFNGVQLSSSPGTKITNCDVYNNYREGICVASSDNTQITGCAVHNNDKKGITLSFASNVQIKSSNIYANGYHGVSQWKGSNNQVHHCNIYGNMDDGVFAVDSPLDATYNWWGSSDGPSGLGPGSGDSVHGDVLYDPWLTKAYSGEASEQQKEEKGFIPSFEATYLLAIIGICAVLLKGRKKKRIMR